MNDTLAPPQPIPITVNDRGVWRVKGSRVTVESVIRCYLKGATPEQIQDDFPTISLAAIYEVIGYYLNHMEEVDHYLTQQQADAEKLREEWSLESKVRNLRTKIRAARVESQDR